MRRLILLRSNQMIGKKRIRRRRINVIDWFPSRPLAWCLQGIRIFPSDLNIYANMQASYFDILSLKDVLRKIAGGGGKDEDEWEYQLIVVYWEFLRRRTFSLVYFTSRRVFLDWEEEKEKSCFSSIRRTMIRMNKRITVAWRSFKVIDRAQYVLTLFFLEFNCHWRMP